jgi:hypothetical protein
LDDNGTVYTEDLESTAIRSLPANWDHYANMCGDYASRLAGGLAHQPELRPAWRRSGICEMADSVLVMLDETTPSHPHPNARTTMSALR